MTHTDYELIASAIRMARARADNEEQQTGIDTVVAHLACVFADNNSFFKEMLFLASCEAA